MSRTTVLARQPTCNRSVRARDGPARPHSEAGRCLLSMHYAVLVLALVRCSHAVHGHRGDREWILRLDGGLHRVNIARAI